MKKYIEIGIGNRWLVRTEIEHEDGTETEVRGIARPFTCKTLYVRIWLGKKVLVIDSREGFKITTKNRNKFKLIVGLSGL